MNEAQVRKPSAAQQMQHPNSMRARMAKDRKLRAEYKVWKKQCDADYSAMEQHARKGFV